MGVLLMGSLPGIVIGSYSALRVPETVLRVALATVLILVAGKIGVQELDLQPSMITALSQLSLAQPPTPPSSRRRSSSSIR